MPATAAWLASIEAAINRSLQASAQALGLARQLEGTSIDIDVVGFERVRIAAAGGRLALLAADAAPANATLTGSPLALLQLFRGGAGSGSASEGGGEGPAVAIEGDAEIAGRYRRLLELARPDLEEELSRWIGDFPARRVSMLARGALDWMRRAGRAARDNVAEYLEEEGRDLVNRTELEEFLRGVDGARESVDRIEARLARLEARAAVAP
ncbi:MAG TPA: SCP2 sterol-binding domain-containing protein [Steroidobacteraceae bacterium]|jgi:ubiquinone biosynthesis protein UbiJ|nr:SCP2 sterol-binding domain-containing protein [Steroidobacteraceae bacterium]